MTKNPQSSTRIAKNRELTEAESTANFEATMALLQLIHEFSPPYKVQFMLGVVRAALPIALDADKELLEFEIETAAQEMARTDWHNDTQYNERIISRALEIVRARKLQEEHKRRNTTRKKAVSS